MEKRNNKKKLLAAFLALFMYVHILGCLES